MTGYERLLARCNDEEKADIKNAIRCVGRTSAYCISYFDMANRRKILVSRPPFSEKWTACIADYGRYETKIICEDGVVDYVDFKKNGEVN